MLVLWIVLPICTVCAVVIAILLTGVVKAVRLNAVDAWLVEEFSRCNVIVFGKKGSGKDLLFCHVIALRGDTHYANMPYNELTEVVNLSDVSAGDNSFETLVKGEVKKFDPYFEEGKDIYISDCGIYLPALQGSRILDDLYPSMPILFALSRQLYQNNIHCNTQALSRIWIKLREQADSYIRVIESKQYEEYILVRFEAYDDYDKAAASKDPIKRGRFRVYYSEIEYDTRYFRKIFFNKAGGLLEDNVFS